MPTRQYRVHPSNFSFHFSFSSSLPNCCELFAVAISAIPAFIRLSKIVQRFHLRFSLSRTTVFILSHNAAALISISRIRRPPLAPALLPHPHPFLQSIIADHQIHLDPFTGSLFADRQAQRTERTPLHAHAQHRR